MKAKHDRHPQPAPKHNRVNYDEGVDMHDNQDIFSDNHDVDMDVGTEDSQEAGQDPAAISKKCEFFVLSPR